jgi:hypothetical protein
MMNLPTRDASRRPKSRQNADKEIILNEFQDCDLQRSQGRFDDCTCDMKEHELCNVSPPASPERHDMFPKRKEERLYPSSNQQRNPKRSDIRSKRPSKIAGQGTRGDDGHDLGTPKPVSPMNSPERRSRSSYSKRPSERLLISSAECAELHPLRDVGRDGKSKTALTSRRPSQHGSTGSDTMAASAAAQRLRRAASDRNVIPSPHNSPQRRSSTEKASPSRRQMIHRLGTTSAHSSTSGRRFSLSTKSLSARSLYQEEIATDQALASPQIEIERKGLERRKPNSEYTPPTLTRSVSTRSAMRRKSLSVVSSQSHDARAEGPTYSTELEPQRVERKRSKGVDAKASSSSSRRPSKSADLAPSKPARLTAAEKSCHGALGQREDSSAPSSFDRHMIRRGSSRRLVSTSKETDQLSGTGADSNADSASPNTVPSTALPNESTRLPEPLTKPVSETRRRLHAGQSSRRLLIQDAAPESTGNSGSSSSNAAPAPRLDPPKARRRFSTGSSQHDAPFSFGGLRQMRCRESPTGADDSPKKGDIPNEPSQRPSKSPAAEGQLKNSLHQLCASTFGGVSLHKNHKHSDLVSVASEMTDVNVAANNPPSTMADRTDAARAERAAPRSSSGSVAAPYCASSIQIDLSDPTNIDFYFFKTAHRSAALGMHYCDDTTTVTTTRSFG